MALGDMVLSTLSKKGLTTAMELRQYLQDFYSSSEPLLWHGYLVLAIDGNKAEVTNSEENKALFGENANQCGNGPTRTLVSGIYDVWNHFFLNIQIAPVSASPSSLL